MQRGGAGWRWLAVGVATGLAAALALVAWQRSRIPQAFPQDESAPAAASDFKDLAGTRVHFATQREARMVVSRHDDWARACGEVQRGALMDRTRSVSLEAFLQWQADNVQPWPPAEQQRWQRALAAIAPRFNALHLPLPPQVLLIRSTGRESADTPHTRANAIVLPAHSDLQGFTDGELLAHELWHVVSRYSPGLATRLYALIGFEPVGELQWPNAWLRKRIADQDAPHWRHAMRAHVDGELRWIMPVVVAVKDEPDRSKGETIEHLMQVRLLEVEPGFNGQPTLPVMRGNEPVWHRVDDVPDYLEHLGGNTDYVLHPEETIADNVMLLVSQRPVPNPALLRKIEAAIRESGASSAPDSRS